MPGLSEVREPRDKYVIGVADRYFPAWNEVTARISLRQSVQIAHVAAVGAVFLPFLGLVFTTWFIHHDLVVALLCA